MAALDDWPPILHLPGPEVLSRWELARRLAARLGLDEGTFGAPGPRPESRDAPRSLSLDFGLARRTIGWRPSPI